MVDEALAQTRAVQRRVRDLPSRVVVYLLLAACLSPELGYAGVWGKLTAGLEGLPVAAPTAGALAQARRRVGVAPLRWLFELLRGPAAAPHGRGVWWRGLLVCAIDGTIMSVPDAPANLARFTKQAGNHGGTGYPQVRLLALVACGTRTLIDAVFGSTTKGETTYAPGLLRSLPGRDDHAGRPELHGRPAGRQDRRHRGAVPDPGAHQRRRPQAPRPGPLRRRLIPLTLRRRAGAGHRRPGSPSPRQGAPAPTG